MLVCVRERVRVSRCIGVEVCVSLSAAVPTGHVGLLSARLDELQHAAPLVGTPLCLSAGRCRRTPVQEH